MNISGFVKETMEVPVRGGTIVAEKSTDPENPGIWLSYRPDGKEYLINLCGVENTALDLRDELDADEGDLRTICWNDPTSEDYTDAFVISRRSLQKNTD